MRSLHVCNAANVAYGYCKILREAGHESDLRCHDITHLMSQPEWDDLPLDPDAFPDENNFFANHADLGDYRRPAWFQTPPVLAQDPLSRGVRGVKQRVMNMLPAPVANRLRRWYRGASRSMDEGISAKAAEPRFSERFHFLKEESRRYGPEWQLTDEMLAGFLPQARWLARQLNGHDVVVAYMIAPIYPMLLGTTPYVSVEIGTMRDIPFDGSAIGKLLAMAYRLSDHVLITNPDVIQQARQLGLERYTFCPHPVDEDRFRPADDDSPLRSELCARHGADFLLFAPARQNWPIKGNDRIFRAFARLLAHGVRAVLLVPAWGTELDRSRQLVSELGLGDRVVWLRPMSEPLMVQYYQACDAVLDQFQLGVFGLITCKALACGVPVVTSYDEKHHQGCFAEHPPLLRATTEDDIFAALRGLAENRWRGREIGAASRRWVERHHSKAVVRARLQEIMSAAGAHFDRKHFEPGDGPRNVHTIHR
jgi:glycosyltransferase involved in cell wall biosynthesis